MVWSPSTTLAALLLLRTVSINAFSTPTCLSHNQYTTPSRPTWRLHSSSSQQEQQQLLQGLDSPVARILESSPDYYKAQETDKVVEVMQQLQQQPQSVALVYNDVNSLVGLFTERDYIQFSTQRPKESGDPLKSMEYFQETTLQNYYTKLDQLIGIAPTDTAQSAIAVMQQNGIRHLIVSESVRSDNGRVSDSIVPQILGVLSLSDILQVMQNDKVSALLPTTTLSQKYPNTTISEQLILEQQSVANKMANNPQTEKEDRIRIGAIGLGACFVGLFFSQATWLHTHADWVMIGIFTIGYVGIILEEFFELNKAGAALLMSTGLWVTYADYFDSAAGKASDTVLGQLGEQLAEVSDICFFLLAASTIVEVVDSHQGFKVVTNKITTTSKKELFWTIGFLTFFLSAILNNLTVTIVMVSLLRKLVPNFEDRRLFGAMVVVAANAGGVWTPIGDVTTTMLWINNELSTVNTVTDLFLPSVVCLVASLAFLVRQVEEDGSLENSALPEASPLSQRGQLVFCSGIASLLSVPVFNELTGLPPYLAMLTGLGVMWTLTDIIHMGEEGEEGLKVPAALSKLDTSGILFFLGILMSIGVLDKSGLLKQLAVFLSDTLPSLDIIATAIGLFSALIDNVPLVAATMGMYDLSDYGTDDKLWQLIALCAGTGGSILIIGSASGVALMGLEKVDFVWYTKKVSIGAAVGYFAGIATYLAQYAIFNGGLLGGVLPQAAVAADIAQQNMASVL